MKVIPHLIALLTFQLTGGNGQEESTLGEILTTLEPEQSIDETDVTKGGDEAVIGLPPPIINDAITESEISKSYNDMNREGPIEQKINPNEIPEQSFDTLSRRSLEGPATATPQPTTERNIESDKSERTSAESDDTVSKLYENYAELQENYKYDDVLHSSEGDSVGERIPASNESPDSKVPSKSRRMMPGMVDNKGRSGRVLTGENSGHVNHHPSITEDHNHEYYDNHMVHYGEYPILIARPNQYWVPVNYLQELPQDIHQQDWGRKLKRFPVRPNEPLQKPHPPFQQHPQKVQHLHPQRNLPISIYPPYLRPVPNDFYLPQPSQPFHHPGQQLTVLQQTPVIKLPIQTFRVPRYLHYRI